MARCNDFAASILVCCLLAHHASRLEETQAADLEDQFLVARRACLRPVILPPDACFELAVLVDPGHKSVGLAVVPAEGQPMQLILVEALLFDAVAADGPDDAMSHSVRLPRALELAVAFLPLVARGVIAGLRSGKCQVRADFVEECSVNLKGHRICGLP